MTDREIEKLTDQINAALADNGYKFGPVRIRLMTATLPEHDASLGVTDANGRRCILACDVEVARAVVALHNRHKHRIALDNETAYARRFVEQAFEGLTNGRIDLAIRDALDGRRDSFMVFQADLDVLSESLAWRRMRVDYRPYSVHGTDIRSVVLTQRRRLALLEAQNGDRKAALTCCPVLARHVTDARDGAAWHARVDMALEDMTTGDMAHFRDGKLIGDVELGDGAVWSDGRIKLGRQLPETVMTLLKGRPLSDVVTHPYLPDGLMITGASQKGRRTTITTDARNRTVPLGPVIKRIKRRPKAMRI